MRWSWKTVTGAVAFSAAVLAGAAKLTGNLDTLGDFVGRMFRMATPGTVAIALRPPAPDEVSVFVVSPEKKSTFLCSMTLSASAVGECRLPSQTFYRIMWRGPSVKVGSTDDIPAIRGRLSFGLTKTGDEKGLAVLSLLDESEKKKLVPPGLASVNVLVARQPLSPDFLPRASKVIGLFETGSLDCESRVFVSLRFGSGVGCFYDGVPGSLTPLLRRLGEARLREIAGDGAPLLLAEADRRPADFVAAAATRDPAKEARLAAALRALLGARETTDFLLREHQGWLERADRAAASIGLTSERARLFCLDRVVNSGRVRTEGYLDAIAKAPDRYPTEADKLLLLASFQPAASFPQNKQRMELIARGRGELRGATVDLGRLGFKG